MWRTVPEAEATTSKKHPSTQLSLTPQYLRREDSPIVSTLIWKPLIVLFCRGVIFTPTENRVYLIELKVMIQRFLVRMDNGRSTEPTHQELVERHNGVVMTATAKGGPCTMT